VRISSISRAADCIAFNKGHTSAIAGNYVHESVLHEIAPGIEGANLHCCHIASIMVEGAGIPAGWALEKVVPQNCQITGGILVRADAGQTAQENEAYIEEGVAPRGHSEMELGCGDSEPICTALC